MKLSKDLWILNLKTFKWKRVYQNSYITERENPVFVSNPDTQKLFLLGGNSENEIHSFDTIYELDLSNKMNDIENYFDSQDISYFSVFWKEIKLNKISDVSDQDEYNCKLALFGSTISVKKNEIYIFGGHDNNKIMHNSFFKIDLTNYNLQKLNNQNLNEQYIIPRINPVT